MNDWIYFEKDQRHISRERAKARKMRQSQWWKTKLSQGTCHYCQKQYSPQELTMDHIVPLARNGKSSKGNIVASCKSCNQTKQIMTPAEILMQNSSIKNY